MWSDNGSIVSASKSHNFSLLAVKSVSNHWSVGSSLTAYTSTYSNIKFAIKPAPALEYDFFPYSESTRRQLRISWKPSYSFYRYREETIYDKASEGLTGQTLSATLELKEKWGTISTSFEAFDYFNDLKKNAALFGVIASAFQRAVAQCVWQLFAYPRPTVSGEGRSVAGTGFAAPHAIGYELQLWCSDRDQLYIRVNFQQRRQSAFRILITKNGLRH
jgi:hypothetical protein